MKKQNHTLLTTAALFLVISLVLPVFLHAGNQNITSPDEAKTGEPRSAIPLQSDSIATTLSDVQKIPFARRFLSNTSSLGLAEIQKILRGKVAELTSKILGQHGKKLTARERKKIAEPDFVFAVSSNEFFRNVTPADFKRLAKRDRKQVAEFLRWLFSNPEIFLQFNELGPIPHKEANAKESPPWFSEWFELYTRREDSRKGLGRKAAIALAQVNACGKIYRNSIDKALPAKDVLERFSWFMKSASEGIFLSDVDKMSAGDLRFILGTHFSLTDLIWCQNRMNQPGFQWKSADTIAQSYRLVPYRSKNANNVHISDTHKFYEGNPLTIETYTRYGGTCVAVSRTGAAFCAAAGVPVFLALQPNHLAFFWKNSEGIWHGGNNLAGWHFSIDQKRLIPWPGIPEKVILYDEFHRDKRKIRESLLLTQAARNERPASPTHIALNMRALEMNAQNCEALEELLQIFSTTTDRKTINRLCEYLLDSGLSGFEKYPLILLDALENSKFITLLQATKSRKEYARLCGGIYNRFARAEKTALPGAADIATIRFYARIFPGIKGKLNDVHHLSEMRKHLKTHHTTLSPNSIAPSMSELELLLSSQFEPIGKIDLTTPHVHKNSRQTAANFFSIYSMLCERSPRHKRTALQFLDTLGSETSIPGDLLLAWKQQIGGISNKSTPTRPAKPSKKSGAQRH
ncbi:MAG: hypothetical protein LBD01_04055 [Puniceicoccales bacterium]|nr:hypothetical protein [Puniceicoccales bacterium]